MAELMLSALKTTGTGLDMVKSGLKMIDDDEMINSNHGKLATDVTTSMIKLGIARHQLFCVPFSVLISSR